MPPEDDVSTAGTETSTEAVVPEAHPAPRRRRPPRWLLIASGATLLLIAVVALSGGFAAVPSEDRPVYGLGDTYANDLYSITVDSVEVTGTDPVTDEPLGHLSIVAEAEILFEGDEPPARAADWLRPLDVELAPEFVGLRSTRDGAIFPPVQPGLPVSMFYIWRLPDDTALRPGDSVPLGIYVRYVDVDSPLEGVTSAPTLVGVVDPEVEG